MSLTIYLTGMLFTYGYAYALGTAKRDSARRLGSFLIAVVWPAFLPYRLGIALGSAEYRACSR